MQTSNNVVGDSSFSVRLSVIKMVEAVAETRTRLPQIVANILSEFTELVSGLEPVYSRSEILELIEPLRKMAAASPFVHRAQRWPRGYAGDFETIHQIILGENKATPGTAGYEIERFFLDSPICMQHRNKVTRQTETILTTLLRKRDARILSLGCGTSEDIHQCLATIKNTNPQITLIDIEADALQFSFNRLIGTVKNIKTLHGNIYKLARQLDEQFDLIVIGGVFDYMNDRVIVELLKQLGRNIYPGGNIFFTNIARGNPYRIPMEYLADWILIERDEEDILRLIEKSDIFVSSNIEKDITGLTYLVTLSAPSI